MVGLFYKAVAVLADEDKIGGSAISRCLKRERGASTGEKFVANAFCTFKDDRVRLTEILCVELNL